MTQQEIMRLIDDEARRQGKTLYKLAQPAGVHSGTLYGWMKGKHSPVFQDLNGVLAELGLTLTVTRLDE